jgi:hypothetical protein
MDTALTGSSLRQRSKEKNDFETRMPAGSFLSPVSSTRGPEKPEIPFCHLAAASVLHSTPHLYPNGTKRRQENDLPPAASRKRCRWRETGAFSPTRTQPSQHSCPKFNHWASTIRALDFATEPASQAFLGPISVLFFGLDFEKISAWEEKVIISEREWFKVQKKRRQQKRSPASSSFAHGCFASMIWHMMAWRPTGGCLPVGPRHESRSNMPTKYGGYSISPPRKADCVGQDANFTRDQRPL